MGYTISISLWQHWLQPQCNFLEIKARTNHTFNKISKKHASINFWIWFSFVFFWFFGFFSSVSHNYHWIPLGCHCSYRFVSLHKAMAKTSSYTLNEEFIPTEFVPCTFLLIKGRKSSLLFLQHFKVKTHIGQKKCSRGNKHSQGLHWKIKTPSWKEEIKSKNHIKKLKAVKELPWILIWAILARPFSAPFLSC